MKRTFDRLGIPEAEQKFLSGVGAQYDSEVVYHKIKENLEKQGVLFLSTDHALRDHEELFRQYFGTVIPPTDNKFAALNSAVWSGGSFIYVPKGVRVDVPLQAYFRINTKDMGQFERTLIIVDEGAYVHYVEGCTAPTYSSDSLHSAVVEIIVKAGGRCRYTTIQNWSNNVYNLVTKRAAAYRDATMEWVDGNLGSKLTMKYPAIYLMEPGAHGEVLSIAFAGKGQHQDAGAKAVHVAPNTTSKIVSKSISKDGGRAGYRGLVKVAKGAVGCRSTVNCDALILDETSRSDTYPTMEIEEDQVSIGHEATVSQDRRRAALLPDEPRRAQGRGGGDDRRRLHRAGREGAADGVRGRDEPPHPAADGGLGRMTADAQDPDQSGGAGLDGWLATGARARGARRTSRPGRWSGGARRPRWRRALPSPGRVARAVAAHRLRRARAGGDGPVRAARAPARNVDDLPAGGDRAPGGRARRPRLVVQRDGEVVLEQTHPALAAAGRDRAARWSARCASTAAKLEQPPRRADRDRPRPLRRAAPGDARGRRVRAACPTACGSSCRSASSAGSTVPGAAGFPAHGRSSLGSGAQATVLEECVSETAEGAAFFDGGTEVFVGEDAKLVYGHLQDWGRNVFHYSNQRARIERGGELQWIQTFLGGRMTKTNSYFRSRARGRRPTCTASCSATSASTSTCTRCSATSPSRPPATCTSAACSRTAPAASTRA